MSFIEEIDNEVMQAFISIVLGLVLGFLLKYTSPSTIIINSDNMKELDNMEKNALNSDEKCYRYKKVETSCSD